MLAGSCSVALAQSVKHDSASSASSGWQYVQLQRNLVSAPVVFTELFTTNGRAGQRVRWGSYTCEVADSSYRIRRTGTRGLASARPFISLPDSLNLNRAAAFVIDVEMFVPNGVLPESGLLFGAGDNANYALTALRGQADCVFTQVVNGSASSVNLSKRRSVVASVLVKNAFWNRLRVEKRGDKLFVTINGDPVASGPVAFGPSGAMALALSPQPTMLRFRHLSVRVSR